MTALVLATALGCHGSEGSSTDGQDTYVPDDPLPYEPALDVDVAEPSLEGLAEAITQAAGVAYSFHADPVVDAYDAIMSAGDEYCPQVYEKEGGAVWYSGCSSSSGTSYAGFGYQYDYVDFADENGTVFNGAQIYGQMTLTDAAGRTFHGDGVAMSLVGHTDQGAGKVFYSGITGAFQWTGARDESWLFQGDSAGITVYAADYESYGLRYVQFLGSVQVEEAGGIFAVAFDNDIGTLIESDGLGAECWAEPGGIISVRDPNAIWYDVAFDGPTSDGASLGDPTRCDGCGEVTVNGELDRIDLSGLLHLDVLGVEPMVTFTLLLLSCSKDDTPTAATMDALSLLERASLDLRGRRASDREVTAVLDDPAGGRRLDRRVPARSRPSPSASSISGARST